MGQLTCKNMGLSDQLYKELRDALIDAFPDKSSLEEMLWLELKKKNLDVIAGGEGNYRLVVFRLIKTADAENWVKDLIDAARKSNPGNSNLEAIAKTYGVIDFNSRYEHKDRNGMVDSKLPEQRDIKTEGGNRNEHVERNYTQSDKVNYSEQNSYGAKSNNEQDQSSDKQVDSLVITLSGIGYDKFINDKEIQDALSLLLQRASGFEVNFKKIEKGSIKITLDGNPEGLKRLAALIQSGELGELREDLEKLGLSIEDAKLVVKDTREENDVVKSSDDFAQLRTRSKLFQPPTHPAIMRRPEEKYINVEGERSTAFGDGATDNKVYSGDNRSITIEKDAISSAIISGNGNKVVIYQYQLERQVSEETTSHSEEIGPNPYKGLLAFQSEDRDHYFGREKQVEKLWNLFRTLHENTTQTEVPLRLLPILGPSGCGKSSLARAGLIPELARHPLPGKSQARVAVLVPGTHPVEALATVLARVATNDPIPVAKTKEFEQVLKEGSDSTTDTIIYDGLRRIANVLPEIAVSPLVVLIDQFEEVYSLCDDTKERQIFIENLIHAAGDRAGCVSVIITLHSDFLGETQRHPALNQVIAKQGVIVPAMSEEELRRAITKPAEIAGHPLDEAVVTLLLKDAEGREGALPLLQFALTRIWEGLKKGVGPIKTLKEIGGVGGALADEAQRIYQTLNYSEKQIARRVFLGLVQLGEGTSDTRRRADVNSFVSYKEQPEYVKRVIDRFAHPGVRLVTLSSQEGTETAEVTHEALFANWGQMQEWLDSSRSDIRFQRRLDEAALHWDNFGRPVGSLWRSPDLDLLGEYYQRASDHMTPLQVEFFQASVKAKETRKQAAIKAEKKRKRQRQILIGVLSIGLLCSTITASFALWQWQRSEKQRINAEILSQTLTVANCKQESLKPQTRR